MFKTSAKKVYWCLVTSAVFLKTFFVFHWGFTGFNGDSDFQPSDRGIVAAPYEVITWPSSNPVACFPRHHMPRQIYWASVNPANKRRLNKRGQRSWDHVDLCKQQTSAAGSYR